VSAWLRDRGRWSDERSFPRTLLFSATHESTPRSSAHFRHAGHRRVATHLDTTAPGHPARFYRVTTAFPGAPLLARFGPSLDDSPKLLRGKQKKWLAPMNRMGCGILAAATEKEL